MRDSAYTWVLIVGALYIYSQKRNGIAKAKQTWTNRDQDTRTVMQRELGLTETPKMWPTEWSMSQWVNTIASYAAPPIAWMAHTTYIAQKDMWKRRRDYAEL